MNTVNDKTATGAAAWPTTGEIRQMGTNAISMGVALARELGWLEGQLAAAENPPTTAERDRLQARYNDLADRLTAGEERLRGIMLDLGETVVALAEESGRVQARLKALEGQPGRNGLHVVQDGAQ